MSTFIENFTASGGTIVVVYLNSNHEVVAFESLSGAPPSGAPLSGNTADHISVDPSVVVERALFHNAVAVILAQQHPSVSDVPTAADRRLTTSIQNALDLAGIRLVDHFIFNESILGSVQPFSFAQSGLL